MASLVRTTIGAAHEDTQAIDDEAVDSGEVIDPTQDVTWPTPNSFSSGDTFYKHKIKSGTDYVVNLANIPSSTKISAAEASKPFFFKISATELYSIMHIPAETTLSIKSIVCTDAKGESATISAVSILLSDDKTKAETPLSEHSSNITLHHVANALVSCDNVISFEGGAATPFAPITLFTNSTPLDTEEANRYVALNIQDFESGKTFFNVASTTSTKPPRTGATTASYSHVAVQYHLNFGDNQFKAHPVAWLAEYNMRKYNHENPGLDQIFRNLQSICIPRGLYEKFCEDLTHRVKETQHTLTPGTSLIIRCLPGAINPHVRPSIGLHTPLISLRIILTPYSITTETFVEPLKDQHMDTPPA